MIHGNDAVQLAGYQLYPRQLTYAHTSQNTWQWPFTAPSAVHLTTCFSPDSQHRGFSVEASLPLSPLQRFSVFFFDGWSIAPFECVCQYFFLKAFPQNLKEQKAHFNFSKVAPFCFTLDQTKQLLIYPFRINTLASYFDNDIAIPDVAPLLRG